MILLLMKVQTGTDVTALYLFAMVIPIMYLFRHEMLPDDVAFYVCSAAGFVGFTALLLEDLKKKLF